MRGSDAVGQMREEERRGLIPLASWALGEIATRVTRWEHEVVDFTRSRVKNISELTNLMKMP